MILRIFLIIVLIFNLGCSRNSTETGNPGVELVLTDFSTTSMQKSGTVSSRSVASVRLCFKRLRFKISDEDTNVNVEVDEDNIDLELGQVDLDPDGGVLTTVSVPPGIYSRIEFDLDSDCMNQGTPSVIVDNDNDGGTPFETDDNMTIKFEGQVSVSVDTRLELAIGNIINALDAVTSADQIKDALEDAGSAGTFTEIDED